MTEEHIKEAISLRFIELIAAENGYKTSSAVPDYGTDLEIKEVGCRLENGHTRYFETGRDLKLQLKATTESSISVQNEIIKYDLNAVTYNDLIERKNAARPLILILFVLPSKKQEWLSLSDDELIVKRCAYWFYPDEEIKTTNKNTVRIEISRKNLIQKLTLTELFETYA